jgi:hypothetical protein
VYFADRFLFPKEKSRSRLSVNLHLLFRVDANLHALLNLHDVVGKLERRVSPLSVVFTCMRRLGIFES